MGFKDSVLGPAFRGVCSAYRPAALALVATVLLLIWAVPSRAADGICSSADVDEGFVLPDGSEHSAGRLTVCVTRDLTPVASLHRTSVDGMPVGAFTSRRTGNEGEGPQYFLFDRDGAGTLRLAGYSCPSGAGAGTFLLDRSGEVRVRQGPRASASKPATADDTVPIATLRDGASGGTSDRFTTLR
jgi:hypothetical protein